MRSLLLVRVDGAATLDRALLSGADALVLDLAGPDGGASEASRTLALDFLRAAQFEAQRPLLYVRVSDLDDPATDLDLAAVALGEPEGFLLATCRSGRDVQHLGAKLAVHEAEYGLSDGEGAIIAECGGAARGLLDLASYGEASPRLMGLSWEAAAFAADLGSDIARNADLTHAGPVAMARHMTLIAARAAGVAAIDGPSPDLDLDGLRAECLMARRDGFNAKIVVSADQAALVNEIFDRDA